MNKRHKSEDYLSYSLREDTRRNNMEVNEI